MKKETSAAFKRRYSVIEKNQHVRWHTYIWANNYVSDKTNFYSIFTRLRKKPAECDIHVHSWTSRFVYILWNLSTYMSIRKRRWFLFSIFFIFDMHRIPQNLANVSLACLMLMWRWMPSLWIFDARAIRYLRQCFQAIGRTEDRPRSGRLRVTTRAQDRYIRTPTCAIASKLPRLLLLTPMVHKTTVYRIPFTQTVHNRLREGGQHRRWQYVGCVLRWRHLVNRVYWARTHQLWLRQQWNCVLFSDVSRFSIYRAEWLGSSIP
jgi:hypothetical protein